MKTKRYLFYWLSVTASYIFPLLYFIIRFSIEVKKKASIPLPILLVLAMIVVKVAVDVPNWVKDWKPSFLKGLLKGLPVFFLFLVFISMGLMLEGVIADLTNFMKAYWEVIGVLFGGLTVGTVFSAFHLKYKEEHLLEQGYTLGVVNK